MGGKEIEDGFDTMSRSPVDCLGACLDTTDYRHGLKF